MVDDIHIAAKEKTYEHAHEITRYTGQFQEDILNQVMWSSTKVMFL